MNRGGGRPAGGATPRRARSKRARQEDTMPLHTTKKHEIIEKFKRHESDTGSPEIQVALLTERISYLTEHFKTHSHDHHSRRGLLKLVGQRRRMLDYLKREDFGRYRGLIQALGLRK
jgi:small subunit ribosomal protein S15